MPFPRRPRREEDSSPRLTLGVLGDLSGTWVGSGLNVRASPAGAGGGQGLRLTVNATRETMTFAAVTVPMFAGGGPEDAELPGVYFLHRANDASSAAMVHAESGGWLSVPRARPSDPATVLRLARGLDDEAVLAQGTHRLSEGRPRIASVSALPIELSTGRAVDAGEHLRAYANAVLPEGIARSAISDPTVMLREVLGARCVARSSVLSVTTAADLSPLVAEIDSSAFSVENPAGLTMEMSLWLHTLVEGHDPGVSGRRLQFCRRTLRSSSGWDWPEVWVGTLARR